MRYNMHIKALLCVKKRSVRLCCRMYCGEKRLLCAVINDKDDE